MTDGEQHAAHLTSPSYGNIKGVSFASVLSHKAV